MTDLLVAIALIAAWATGDLMTAAILPIVMIIGHVLEERSLLGSQEAIRAMGRLVATTTRRLAADGTTCRRCRPNKSASAIASSCAQATACRSTASC